MANYMWVISVIHYIAYYDENLWFANDNKLRAASSASTARALPGFPAFFNAGAISWEFDLFPQNIG
jgi:hypothetical protein